MTRPRTVAALAALLAASGACGKKAAKDEPPPPPPRIGLPAQPPAPPKALRTMSTFLTMDELRAHAPTVPGVRMTAEVALDASGKQALGQGCVTAAGPKVAMHLLADAYGVARWTVKIRQTSDNDTRGEMGADFFVHDGMLHVRGALAASPACKEGEVGLQLYFTKVVDAPKSAPPASGDGGGGRRPPTTP